MKRSLKMVALSVVTAMILAFSPITPLPTANAASTKPVITSPSNKEMIVYKSNNDAVTVTWDAPTGSVSRYIISVRELNSCYGVTNTLIVSGVSVSSATTSYTIASSRIFPGGVYRISVCAELTSGAKKWSNESYFFTTNHNTNRYDAPFSFYISDTFDLESKNAMYYAAQTWNKASGLSGELVNTYAFDKWNHSYTLDVNDSSNCIIEDGDYSDVNYVMQTSMRVSNTILTKGKLLEADINVNTGGYYNAEGEYIDIKWCNGVVANHYDIQSVMAHEMGHVLGFPDFYESFASTWTMYGSGPPGTTAQRSLETADIQYLKQLHS